MKRRASVAGLKSTLAAGSKPTATKTQKSGTASVSRSSASGMTTRSAGKPASSHPRPSQTASPLKPWTPMMPWKPASAPSLYSKHASAPSSATTAPKATTPSATATPTSPSPGAAVTPRSPNAAVKSTSPGAPSKGSKTAGAGADPVPAPASPLVSTAVSTSVSASGCFVPKKGEVGGVTGKAAETAEPLELRMPNGERLALPLGHCTADSVEQTFATFMGAWGIEGDVKVSSEKSSSTARFTYGEILPVGVRRLLRPDQLGGEAARELVDLGCGKGRLALQAFFEFPNLQKVTAVEFSLSRYTAAATALCRLAKANPALLGFSEGADHATLSMGTRILMLRRQDLFDCTETFNADIVFCETDIPGERLGELTRLLTRLKSGTRFLLYHHLLDLPGIALTDDQSTTADTASNTTKPSTGPPESSFQRIVGSHIAIPTSWRNHVNFDRWTKD